MSMSYDIAQNMKFFSLFLMLLGTLFLLIASLGVLRFPDLLTRMAAGSKASTLALLLTFGGALFHPDSAGHRTILILCLIFIFLTAPVAAHLLARASLRSGIKLYSKTKREDL